MSNPQESAALRFASEAAAQGVKPDSFEAAYEAAQVGRHVVGNWTDWAGLKNNHPELFTAAPGKAAGETASQRISRLLREIVCPPPKPV